MNPTLLRRMLKTPMGIHKLLIQNIIPLLYYFSELKFCAINLNFLKIKNTVIRTFFKSTAQTFEIINNPTLFVTKVEINLIFVIA
ncbi:hypothetical protein BpHYR1_049613 [Brachionus plicatilis]|uniref:RNA-directed DNA polymerase from mobile element jockey-like n=1 Tax=Brachionus plicatilis TaxID=10195 RepID=A0A3M7QE31_BRAPC|nr:hypothetical protein BpHYR1_049613 [Brachionus plicatilis]